VSFETQGFEVINLGAPALSYVNLMRSKLEEKFGKLTTFHERAGEEITVERSQACSVAYGNARAILTCEFASITRLAGLDLLVQTVPFVRISRPGIAEDNIGFHRDTWYGDTPYELSCWIPLTDTDVGNCLRICPGSHLWSEAEHPVEQFNRIDVSKGSAKHDLGFLYAPKRLVERVDMAPLPLKVGQMVVFSLALLHGQEVNSSTATRFSIDIRLANKYAPIKLQRSRSENYYEEFSASPLSRVAKRYYEAQK